MQAPTEKDLQRAIKMREEGRKMSDICEATKLNYSQVWLAIRDAEIEDRLRVNGTKRTPVMVRELRLEKNLSWGEISVRFGYTEYPESKIRKMFKEASGFHSQGLRIGKGGRQYMDPVFYKDEHRKIGTNLDEKLSRAEIRELAAKLRAGGVEPKKALRVAKKATKSTNSAVKAAKKAPAKKKATKKAAPKVTEPIEEAGDPFEE